MNIIFIELNEINFDVVSRYIENKESLPNFKYLINQDLLTTSSEKEYHLLEPWVQWVSAHTGKPYKDHKVFRLGDIVNTNEVQLFEKIEQLGYKVGAISPMNAKNELLNASYFIPDPWTKTSVTGGKLIEGLSSAISQAVNDNAQSRLKLKSILSLVLSFFVLINPKKWFPLITYAISCFKKHWRKAIFLDLFLHEIHQGLINKHNPGFSTIFFNAGAHIQHHYFFNSSVLRTKKLNNPSWYIDKKEDPLLDLLKIYDQIIGDYLSRKNYELILATGLSQKPYDKVKFYYRLTRHEEFLRNIGISFEKVTPRMTRDFLISFSSQDAAKKAEKDLRNIHVNNDLRLFDKIDNRGNELFVTLTFPNEITETASIVVNGENLKLMDHLTFVAIKNGMHDEKGFTFFSKNIRKHQPRDGDNISSLYHSILNCFTSKDSRS